MRSRGIVTATREQNWMIYSLPKRRSRDLKANLTCLQDCVRSKPVFARDLQKLVRLRESCCEPASVFAKPRV
jgi:ArsR family transcriptional regulator